MKAIARSFLFVAALLSCLYAQEAEIKESLRWLGTSTADCTTQLKDKSNYVVIRHDPGVVELKRPSDASPCTVALRGEGEKVQYVGWELAGKGHTAKSLVDFNKHLTDELVATGFMLTETAAARGKVPIFGHVPFVISNETLTTVATYKSKKLGVSVTLTLSLLDASARDDEMREFLPALSIEITAASVFEEGRARY